MIAALVELDAGDLESFGEHSIAHYRPVVVDFHDHFFFKTKMTKKKKNK